MRRGRDPFSLDGEDRDQNGFRTPQAYSSHSQRQNSFTHPDRPTGRSPGLSESVNSALKELRTMSSLNKEGGRDFQSVSDFRNSPHQLSRVHGLESSGNVQNSGSHQRPGMQPPPFASGSPFPPPLPPPPFNPSLSLPPPGLSPFHNPPPTLHPAHPEAMLGHPSRSEVMLGRPPGSEVMLGHPPGSDMKYDYRPPPLPQQGARPVQPLQNPPRGVSMPYSATRPPHPVGMAGVAAAPNSANHPLAPHGNFRMPGHHEGIASGPTAYPRGSVPPPGPSHLSEGVGGARLAFPQGAAAPPHSPFRPPLPVPHQLPASGDLGKPMPGSVVHSGQGDFVAPGPVWKTPGPVWKTPGEVDGGSRNAGAQEEVNAWLKKMGKGTRGDAVITDKHRTGKEFKGSAMPGTESTEKQMTISEVQHKLHSVLHALAAMQGQTQQMEDTQETADTPTWTASVAKIKQLKEAYLEAKEKLDMDQVKRLKQKLDQRRKKRRRQKHNRLEEKEAEQEMQFERAQKHAVIDQWRQKLQQDDRNNQQMKKMKETADRTLSKVRKEIREARKMLDTVSRLQKLRAIRSDTAEKRGQTFPPSVAAHFTEKTDDLIQLITSQVQAFEKEEDALKLILQTENEEAKEKEREEKRQKEREDRKKDIEEERQSLFGMLEMPGPGDPLQPYTQFYLQAQCSLQALQNIRHEWDAFVVAENTPLASRIPDGWVSPEQPSSSAWASVLQSEPS